MGLDKERIPQRSEKFDYEKLGRGVLNPIGSESRDLTPDLEPEPAFFSMSY